MTPDWYERAMEMAMDRHDPEDHDNREWDALTVEEQQLAIDDVLYDIADSI